MYGRCCCRCRCRCSRRESCCAQQAKKKGEDKAPKGDGGEGGYVGETVTGSVDELVARVQALEVDKNKEEELRNFMQLERVRAQSLPKLTGHGRRPQHARCGAQHNGRLDTRTGDAAVAPSASGGAGPVSGFRRSSSPAHAESCNQRREGGLP